MNKLFKVDTNDFSEIYFIALDYEDAGRKFKDKILPKLNLSNSDDYTIELVSQESEFNLFTTGNGTWVRLFL